VEVLALLDAVMEPPDEEDMDARELRDENPMSLSVGMAAAKEKVATAACTGTSEVAAMGHGSARERSEAAERSCRGRGARVGCGLRDGRRA
jgi:hypothetical protein